MTLRQFLRKLRAHDWLVDPEHRTIRTMEAVPAILFNEITGEEDFRSEHKCPLAMIAGERFHTGSNVEDFAEALDLDDDLCSDIVSAADMDAGNDYHGKQLPFTRGRVVKSLPRLRNMLLRACGQTEEPLEA